MARISVSPLFRWLRAIAPWVTESPILIHVRSSDDDSPANLQRMKGLADYARFKHIALGGFRQKARVGLRSVRIEL